MPIPRDTALDASLALLREGYTFTSARAARLGSDAFWARVAGRRALFALGHDAARTFYERGAMTRQGALPPTALRLLLDVGSVGQLDGEAHHHRKRLFLDVLTGAPLRGLRDAFTEAWYERLPAWTEADAVVLFDEFERILCRAVCRWAGVPLDDDEVGDRARDIATFIDAAGSVGPRLALGALARRRTERWLRGLVADARAGRVAVDPGTALGRLLDHRQLDGSPLDDDVAAVELLNIVRPTVAVARFATFAATALYQHPDERPDPSVLAEVEAFAQEVRRAFPFFPMIGGRATEAFEWRGEEIDEGTWMLLDLYGTDHDPRLWEEPQAFRPSRFHAREVDPFELVPQGGGDAATGHRCAGEDATIELLVTAVELLQTSVRYTVPVQDLSIDLGRLPTAPRSRFVIRDVQRR